METAQKRETELGRAAETSEQRNEKAKGELGTLLKLLVKDKLLHSEKVRECGAETPEEREMRNGSSAIHHFERGDEDLTELPSISTQDCHTHVYFHPFIHTCPFIAQERLDSTILT